jgi:hypothetical protein
MKNNEKKLFLIKNGLSINLVTDLNEGQVNSLYKRIVESKTGEKCACGCDKDTCKCGPECKKCDCGKKKKQETKEQTLPQNTTKVDKVMTTYKVEPGKKTMINGVEIDTTGGQTKVTPMKETENIDGEIDEKSVSQKQQEFFGVVRAMQKGKLPKKGKAGEAADEMSKKDVKDFASTKHKGLPKRKETKEGYFDAVSNAYYKNMSEKMNELPINVTFESKLEKDINDIIESTLYPKMSKRDLINLIRENSPLNPDTEEETITKPKTPTKPEINPDFDPFTNPDPKDDPEAEGKDFFVSMAKDMGLIRN